MSHSKIITRGRARREEYDPALTYHRREVTRCVRETGLDRLEASGPTYVDTLK
jgi:hypothetical protein